MRIIVWLILSSIFFNVKTYADEFIGQWHLFSINEHLIAQTIDGHNILRIEVSEKQEVSVVFILNDFVSFANQEHIFEYSSPTYGRIRTDNYLVEQQRVLIKNHYEVNRFIENLKDISSHIMFSQENFGNSFKDRKITITYLDTSAVPTFKRTAFSTVEIDQVLEKLGLS